MRETNQTTTRKRDIGLLIAFLDFLCRILDPMNPNANLLTMQTVSNFHNMVVLGSELGEVSYVESRYRAAPQPGLGRFYSEGTGGHPQGTVPRPSRGNTGGILGKVCGVWCRRRWVHLVSSQQMSRFPVRMPQMPQMLWVGGWLTGQR